MVNPNSLKKLFVPQCFRLRTGWEGQDEGATSGAGGHTTLWWHKESGHHHYGDYSMAVIKGNIVVEDHSQLESGVMSLDPEGPFGTFVGIYDGHGGADTSRFISDRLFDNMKRITTERGGMSRDVIRGAFMATEEEFLARVAREWEARPTMASVGSCCLVGVVCGGMIYVANSGDSRAVLGRSSPEQHMEAIALSRDHNANVEIVRDELIMRHPDDDQIVFQKDGVWRVKGIIQISRSIGDAYLKRREFNRPPLIEKYMVPGIFEQPILLAEPTVEEQGINPRDEFIIFASDGLWDNLTNQEAVDIVYSKSRKGIAKTLVKAALKALAQGRGMKYKDLKRIEMDERRQVHDDISVVVLFLDSKLISRSSSRNSSSHTRPTVSERTYALDINRTGTSSGADRTGTSSGVDRAETSRGKGVATHDDDDDSE
ncbi:probable protein phosphatase 2C 38 [Salvia splendens]|uniref:probable protein phosphatase 2C 38 n=1 Tax=Salvia splendens TaxID=180675 RepID=UPI001C259C24|nr:probable protein phosphatase 2C 38 [Salvia splendens]